MLICCNSKHSNSQLYICQASKKRTFVYNIYLFTNIHSPLAWQAVRFDNVGRVLAAESAIRRENKQFQLSVLYSHMRAHSSMKLQYLYSYVLCVRDQGELVMGVVKHLDNSARVALGSTDHKSRKSPAASRSRGCNIHLLSDCDGGV